MNANTRKQLQKRKQLLHNTRKASVSVDEVEIREATKEKLRELLSSDLATDNSKRSHHKDPKELAKAIEETLNDTYRAHSSEYKAAFRRLFVSLKSDGLPFKAALLNGDLDPKEYALKPAEALKSSERITSDEKMKQEEMRMSVGIQLLPENVNQVKDGRDREKWGVSKSAAALDD